MLAIRLFNLATTVWRTGTDLIARAGGVGGGFGQGRVRVLVKRSE